MTGSFLSGVDIGMKFRGFRHRRCLRKSEGSFESRRDATFDSGKFRGSSAIFSEPPAVKLERIACPPRRKLRRIDVRLVIGLEMAAQAVGGRLEQEWLAAAADLRNRCVRRCVNRIDVIAIDGCALHAERICARRDAFARHRLPAVDECLPLSLLSNIKNRPSLRRWLIEWPV